MDFFGVCVLYSLRDVILVAFLRYRWMQLTVTLATDHMLAVCIVVGSQWTTMVINK